MKITTTLLLFLALSFGVAHFSIPVASNPAAPPADIVFKNGNIYTVNQQTPHAEAIAAKGDRIIFVGSNAAAQKLVGRTTRVVDLHGATVVPGMTDAHHHCTSALKIKI